MSLNRVLAGTLVAAAAIAVPGSALAIGSAAPGSKAPAASVTVPASKAPAASVTAPASKTPGPSGLSALASSAGLTENRLQSGLIAAKQAGGNGALGVAAFARTTGVSSATAQRIVAAIFGAQPPRLTSPAVAAALAARLGVSRTAAEQALEQLAALAGVHGIDPQSAAFGSIAHRLGVSPAQLGPAVKESIRSAAGA